MRESVHRMPRRSKLVLLVVALALASAGVAYAAIPDSSGVIHGCYTNRGGILSVIDPSAGQTCSSLQTPIAWNQQGPKGDPGPQGPKTREIRALRGRRVTPGRKGLQDRTRQPDTRCRTDQSFNCR
jgi:hypothetical protein